MPPITIAALCDAAKLDRGSFNTLRVSGRAKDWGDEQSQEFALRLGLYSAFKAVGFLTPEAVTYADTLASNKRLPRWYLRNPLDDEEVFVSSEGIEQSSLGALLNMVAGGTGEWVAEDEKPFTKMSFAPPSTALVVIDLHSVRDRMRALFK